MTTKLEIKKRFARSGPERLSVVIGLLKQILEALDKVRVCSSCDQLGFDVFR